LRAGCASGATISVAKVEKGPKRTPWRSFEDGTMNIKMSDERWRVLETCQQVRNAAPRYMGHRPQLAECQGGYK
jgi:hypothetical protein